MNWLQQVIEDCKRSLAERDPKTQAEVRAASEAITREANR
jgi:hypothetical protein